MTWLYRHVIDLEMQKQSESRESRLCCLGRARCRRRRRRRGNRSPRIESLPRGQPYLLLCRGRPRNRVPAQQTDSGGRGIQFYEFFEAPCIHHPHLAPHFFRRRIHPCCLGRRGHHTGMRGSRLFRHRRRNRLGRNHHEHRLHETVHPTICLHADPPTVERMLGQAVGDNGRVHRPDGPHGQNSRDVRGTNQADREEADLAFETRPVAQRNQVD